MSNQSSRIGHSLPRRQLTDRRFAQLDQEATSKDFACGILVRSCGRDKNVSLTPADAYQIGSDLIVVGRPIAQAEDPVVTYHAIK